jgi:hypothetical protein
LKRIVEISSDLALAPVIAPDGIEEGIIATKGFVTYWTGEVPVPGVDENRTIFHVRQ